MLGLLSNGGKDIPSTSIMPAVTCKAVQRRHTIVKRKHTIVKRSPKVNIVGERSQEGPRKKINASHGRLTIKNYLRKAGLE